MSSRMQSARPPASLVHGGGGGGGGGKSKGGAAGGAGGQRPPSATSGVHDQRAKTILKEAVDAVVNSFAKHTQGYGRGTSPPSAAPSHFLVPLPTLSGTFTHHANTMLLPVAPVMIVASSDACDDSCFQC
nr:uncharacterized protein LOC128688536 [Cherax quadricarinatus]